MNLTTLRLLVLLTFGLFLLSACGSSSTPTSDDDLCRAIHQALQAPDDAEFTAFFPTADDIAAMADGLATETDQQREIKNELLEFDAAEIATGAQQAYESIRDQARTDGVDLADGRFEGVVHTKKRFEVPNLACRTVKYLVAFEGRNHVVRVDLLRSPAGYHVFEVRLDTYDTVDVAITDPRGDTVEAVSGMDLTYEVAFDAETANRQGAWVEIALDGKHAGMVAGTTLESPLRREIPGRALTSGTHTLAVRIHPVGQATGYPLGEAVLTIEVP